MIMWNEGMAYAFSMHKTVMNLCGNWPLNRRDSGQEIQWAIGILIEFSMVFLAVVETIFYCGNDPLFIIETLSVLCYGVLNILKNILFRFHLDKMRINLTAADTDWFHALKNKSHRSIMKKYARLGKLIMCLMYFIGFLALPIHIYFLLINQTFTNPSKGTARRLIIIWSWLPAEITIFQYGMLLFAQSIQIFVIFVRMSIIDSCFFCLVMHICGQFEILSMKFRALSTKAYAESEYKMRTGSLVRKHCQVMRLVRNIEKTYNLILLMQFLSCVFFTGTSGYGFTSSIQKQDMFFMLKCIFLTVFMTLQTLNYAYGGECLQIHSEKMRNGIWELSWEIQPRKRVKDLIFVMTRTIVPPYVTGGKFFRVSFMTMKSVFTAAWSCMSIVQVLLTK